jgi:hypothetical protein
MMRRHIPGNAASPKRRFQRAALVAAGLVCAVAGVAADEFRLFPAQGPRHLTEPGTSSEAEFRLVDLEHSSPWGGGAADFRLQTAAAPEAPQEPPPSLAAAPPAPAPRLFTTGTILWSAGTVLGGVAQGLGAPLRHGWESFHFTDEGFFGYDTYAGGADKASHFTVSSGVARLLFDVFMKEGHAVDQSFTLAFAATFLSGTAVEIMDGVSVYGFSFQDLTADFLGAASGLLIQRYCLQDLIGLRLGPAHAEVPASAAGSSEEWLGHGYSDEIYAADLKLRGLVSRLNGKPGVERFLLTSFVYYTKGFGWSPPLPSRYQEMGFELGIDFTAILKEVGLTETTWWGQGLYAFFNFFRIPYTQIGAYYNLTNHKWHGPGAPYRYQSP